MEQVTQAEAMVCEVCGNPLTDGGVDYYCATKGCEDEHTLKNAVLASMRNDRKATRTNDQAKDEEIARLREALEEIVNPLATMKLRAEAEGKKLSGMAWEIARTPSYLQGIAKEALEKSVA